MGLLERIVTPSKAEDTAFWLMVTNGLDKHNYEYFSKEAVNENRTPQQRIIAGLIIRVIKNPSLREAIRLAIREEYVNWDSQVSKNVQTEGNQIKKQRANSKAKKDAEANAAKDNVTLTLTLIPDDETEDAFAEAVSEAPKPKGRPRKVTSKPTGKVK